MRGAFIRLTRPGSRQAGQGMSFGTSMIGSRIGRHSRRPAGRPPARSAPVRAGATSAAGDRWPMRCDGLRRRSNPSGAYRTLRVRARSGRPRLRWVQPSRPGRSTIRGAPLEFVEPMERDGAAMQRCCAITFGDPRQRGGIRSAARQRRRATRRRSATPPNQILEHAIIIVKYVFSDCPGVWGCPALAAAPHHTDREEGDEHKLRAPRSLRSGGVGMRPIEHLCRQNSRCPGAGRRCPFTGVVPLLAGM